MTINRSLRASRRLAGGLILALLVGCGGGGGKDTIAPVVRFSIAGDVIAP